VKTILEVVISNGENDEGEERCGDEELVRKANTRDFGRSIQDARIPLYHCR
jgi:hypothetical protein